MVNTTNIDKYGSKRQGKTILTDECILPFKYKGKIQDKCVKGKTGNWCATSLKPSNTTKTWAYCVKDKKKQYESAMVNDDSSSSKKSSDSLQYLKKPDPQKGERSDSTHIGLVHQLGHMLGIQPKRWLYHRDDKPIGLEEEHKVVDKDLNKIVKKIQNIDMSNINIIDVMSKERLKKVIINLLNNPEYYSKLSLFPGDRWQEYPLQRVARVRGEGPDYNFIPSIVKKNVEEFRKILIEFLDEQRDKDIVEYKDRIFDLQYLLYISVSLTDIERGRERLVEDSELKKIYYKMSDEYFMWAKKERRIGSLGYHTLTSSITSYVLIDLLKSDSLFSDIQKLWRGKKLNFDDMNLRKESEFRRIMFSSIFNKFYTDFSRIEPGEDESSSSSEKEKNFKIKQNKSSSSSEKEKNFKIKQNKSSSSSEKEKNLKKKQNKIETLQERNERYLKITEKHFGPLALLNKRILAKVTFDVEDYTKHLRDPRRNKPYNSLVIGKTKAKVSPWLVVNPSEDINLFPTISLAFEFFKKEKEELIKKYSPIYFEGMDDDEIEEKLPELSFVPVDIKTCDHDTSMIDYDEKLQDKSNKVIRVSNGNCYDIDELVDYLISNNGKNVDPIKSSGGEYVTLWNSKEELLAIRNFPFVDKSKLKDFHQVLDEQLKSFVDKPPYIDIINSEKGKEFLNRLLITGKICTEDYTEDFTPSQTEITRTREYLQENFTGEEIKELKLISTINGLNIDSILLKETGSLCIHGVGFRFCSLYFTIFIKFRETMNLLGQTFNLELFPGVVEVRPNTFMFCHSNVSSFTSVREQKNSLYPLTVLLFDTDNMNRSNTSGGTGRILKIPLKTGWKMWKPTTFNASPWGFSEDFCQSQIRVCEVDIYPLQDTGRENILMQFFDRPDKQKIKGPLSPVGDCKKEKKTAKKKSQSILNQDEEHDKLETSSSDDISFSSGEIDISDEDILLKHKKELTDEEIGYMKARGKLPFKGELIPAIRAQDKDALKILLRARNIEAKSLKKTLKKDSSSSSEKKLQVEKMMKNILLDIYINLESLPGGGSRLPREIMKNLKEDSMKYREFWDADNVIGYIYRDEWSKLIEISKKEYEKTEQIKKSAKKKPLPKKKTIKQTYLISLFYKYRSIPDEFKGESIFRITNNKLSKDCLNKTFILKDFTKIGPRGTKIWSIKVTEVKKRYKINIEYSSLRGPVKKQYFWNPNNTKSEGNPSLLLQKEINNGYILVELKNN